MSKTQRINPADYVRIQTAARELGVLQSSLRYAVLAQNIPCIRTGDGLPLVRICDIQKQIDSGEFRGKVVPNARR
jgi:hypothetical protein